MERPFQKAPLFEPQGQLLMNCRMAGLKREGLEEIRLHESGIICSPRRAPQFQIVTRFCRPKLHGPGKMFRR
jgi:hypothetical protein